jgi:NitT/TauT family transport system ATP-binding protein
VNQVKLGDNDVSPVVSFHSVGFTYADGTRAIRDVTLDVPEGQVLGVCGPSGCGKSTLLSLLANINKPSSGAIAWSPDHGGADSSGRPRHPISMVFQQDTLLPWLTVEGNVGLSKKFARQRSADPFLSELITMVGLDEFRRSLPYQLSGGMRRRLAFITAMAARPRVLLLDEPFSSLDEPTRVAIHQDILSVIKRLGTTVVLVTHDLAEAATLCDEVVILSGHPGTVATRHEVPFGSDRDVLALRQEPAFLELYGKLWHDLRSQIVQTTGSTK